MHAARPGLGRIAGVGLALLLAVACLPVAAHAQATRGTILGTITDQTGAAMPGVTVVITETRTNVSHDTVTNETGNFTFPNIPDGIYNIKAELQGFKTVVREGIRLAVNTSIRVDLALAVGELAETVTVSGETPLLQTDRTDTGRMLESIQVTAMPLGVQPELPGDDGDGARAPAGPTSRTPSSSTRRTASRRKSTASRAWPTTSRSKASTTTSGPAC